MVEESGLEVRSGHRVAEVERRPGEFALRGEGFEVRARRVILALGRRGTPRRLGVPGEDAEKVLYDIVEMEEFRGRKVLVVGGGDSALESAIGLANQEGTEVALSYRGATFDRAKERNRRKLDEVERAGRVRVLRESVVVSIGPSEVVLEAGGRRLALPNDDVIVRVGGEPPSAFLEKAGVRTVTKEIPLEEAKAGVAA
jgi:thioredoxin reductase